MPQSIRSLAKTLEGFFSSKEQVELPQHVLDAVVDYTDNFAYAEPVDSQRLHEELIAIHKLVTEPKYQVPFLEILQHLLPCLTTLDQLRFWFERYIHPALDSAGQLNVLVKASRDFLIKVMIHDYDVEDDMCNKVYSDISRQYCLWILDIYLGSSSWFSDPIKDLNDEERSRFTKMNAKDLLIQFGFKRGKHFMCTLDDRMKHSKHRIATLGLLSVYVSQQPRQLFEIQNTSLLDSIYKCLQYDSSSTALSICSNVLAMILPHICNTMIPSLPKILALYGRLACWRLVTYEEEEEERELEQQKKKQQNEETEPETKLDDSKSNDNNDDENDRNNNSSENDVGHASGSLAVHGEKESSPRTSKPSPNKDGWDTLGHCFSVQDERKPSITPLFTFMYGLFPSNLLSFLRKPSKYLEKRGYTREFSDFWDDYEILAMSKPIFELHMLHPNLVSNTAEQELHDKNRFELIGSATDIASYCLQLYNQTQESQAPPQSPKFEMPFEEAPTLYDGDIPTYSYMYNPEDERTGMRGDDELKIDTPTRTSDRAVMSPQVTLDGLLDQHAKLYTKAESSASTATSKVEASAEVSPVSEAAGSSGAVSTITTTSHADEAISRLRKRSGTLSSPGFIPQVSHFNGTSKTDQGGKSPLIKETEEKPLDKESGDRVPALLKEQPYQPQMQRLESESMPQDKIEELTALKQKLSEQNEQILFLNRELLIQKNELDFVSFIEQHSQYKYKQMRNQLSKKLVSDESIRHMMYKNSSLQKQVSSLRHELDTAQKNTKTYKRERQQYEQNIMTKSKEFRQIANEVTTENDRLQNELDEIKREKELLNETIVAQEVKISQLELRLSEAIEKSKYVDSYKALVSDMEAKVDKIEAQNVVSAPISSSSAPGGSKDYISSAKAHELQAEIDELKLERDASQLEMDQMETKHSKQMEDAQARIMELESQKQEPTNRVKGLIDSFKQTNEQQYADLKAAHEDLTMRYLELDTKFRNFVLQEEDKNLSSAIDEMSADKPKKKSILGYDLDGAANTSTSTEVGESINSGVSDSEHRGQQQHLKYETAANTQQQLGSQKNKSGTEIRIRGRGGVQNIGSTNPTASSSRKSSRQSGSTYRGVRM